MDIATISVVSSAVLAALTIGASVYSAQKQREHEAGLDFEKRVWDRKSAALFEVIEICLGLIETDDMTPINRDPYSVELSMTLDRLISVRAEVEAFASSPCRRALVELVENFETSGVKRDVGRLSRAWRAKAREVGPRGSEEAATEWANQKQFLQLAVDGVHPNIDALRNDARRLLAAARESVRNPQN